MNLKRSAVTFALGLICIVLISGLVLAQSAADSSNMGDLIGSWHTEVTIESQGATFPALLTFGVGGTVVADEPPLPGETSAHGNWINTGDDAVAITFVALFSGEEGAYTGNLKVVGALQYDAETGGWQGPFKIDVVDADDHLVFSDVGTFDLTRIAVELLD